MSVKELNMTTPSYKPEEDIITPYLKAKEEWDNRIGAARVQAANWRFCALGLILLCIVLAGGIIFQSSKSCITPYVVEVGADGAAQAIGPAKEEYIPTEKEIKYFLGQFIQKTRTIPLDPVVAKKSWLSAYAFLRQSAQQKMNTSVKQENPFAKIGSQTVEAEINVIVPMSKNTYQVRWKETVYSKGGAEQESYRMTGLFTIDFSPPTDDKTIFLNPLGLYITNFSWSKEL